MASEKTKSTGCGFTTLFLIFLVLKLTGLIQWDWWVVCIPLVAPFILLILTLLSVGLFLLFRDNK